MKAELDRKKFDDESGEAEKHAKLAALAHIGGILERGMATGLNIREVTGDGNPRNDRGPSSERPSSVYKTGVDGQDERPVAHLPKDATGPTRPKGVHPSESPAENLVHPHMVEHAYGKTTDNVHEVSGDGNPNNAVGQAVGAPAHEDQNEKQARPAVTMHMHKVGADAGPGTDDPEAHQDEEDEDSGHGSPVGMLASETGKAMVHFLKKNKHIR